MINVEHLNIRANRLQIAFCLFVFAVSLIAFWPASTMVHMAPSAKSHLSYRAIQGSIWNGSARGVAVDGIHLGDIQFRVNPFLLLRGRLGGSVSLAGGDVTGEGSFSLGLGRSIDLKNVTAVVSLDMIDSVFILGAPVTGQGQIYVDRLSLSKNGCLKAIGSLSTDILDRPLARFERAPLALSGPIACDGSTFIASLAGVNRDGAMDIGLRVSPDFRYEISAGVEADDEQLSFALISFGFENNGAKLVYNSVGMIRGVKT